jgi:hypothetical protein
MADKHESTHKQINKELGDMYSRMRDPEQQELRELEANQKKDVERTAQRYGLD